MRYTLLLFFCLFLNGCTPRSYPLTILHTNDVHSHLLPYKEDGTACLRDAAACSGGAAREATAAAKVRSEDENVLLVDAGDQFQGTLLFNRFRGAAAQKIMNELAYDAMTLGNHEFDKGTEVLADFIRGARFPIVAANLDLRGEPALQSSIQQFVILRRGSRKIGIFGLTTPEGAVLSSGHGNVKFLELCAAARETVAQIKQRGVDIIIALTHIGLKEDIRLASSVSGIDIIVGGHSHTLLSNIAAGAEGPYPLVVRSPAGEPVLIVTNASLLSALGKLSVKLDREGVAEEWSGEPIRLDGTVVEDARVKAQLAAFARELAPQFNKKIAEIPFALEGDERVCRSGECSLGNLVADAMLWEFREASPDAAMINSGAIRSGLSAGEVSLGRLLEVLPFRENLVLMRIRGADLLAVLEYSVSLAEDPTASGTGRLLQVAGLRFSFDPRRSVGKRVAEAAVYIPKRGYSKIKPDGVYKIVTTSYLHQGGDGHSVLASKAIEPFDFGRSLTDVVAEYLAAVRRLPAAGRIRSGAR